MVLFRKHSAAPTTGASTDTSIDALDAGKGRATPSRKQAEAERKERLKATARGENSRGKPTSAAKSTAREARARARERVRNGEESALSARDRGPERRYARDLIDSRHTVGEYFLYFAVLVLILGLIRVPAIQILSQVMLLLIVVALAVDSFRIYRTTNRAVAAKFPGGNLDGIGRYAVMRGMSTRRMRLPKPQVARGSLSAK